MNSQKHLGVIFNKTYKTIEYLRKLSNSLPRQALITIFKSCIRPHVDYGDVLYNQAFNNSFNAKMESIQYIACLAIAGAISNKPRIYSTSSL